MIDKTMPLNHAVENRTTISTSACALGPGCNPRVSRADGTTVTLHRSADAGSLSSLALETCMTAEQRTQIQVAIRNTPKTLWAYWPFLFPVLIVVAGVAVQIVLVVYFQSKMPEMEVLFRRGTTVEPVWNSQLVREAVLITSLSITVTFVLFILLARLAFRYATLLKTVAKDVGIDEG